MNYREALGWLFGTQRFGIKLGLEASHRLFRALGVESSPNECILHVAGTNGKGSVCAMLDAICRAAGRRTALFTSPHLVTFRERMQVDGVLISEEEVARGLTKIRQLVAEWEPHPTFFEIATALALAHFRAARAEVVILETGMGGRLDSTNAIAATVSVLTPIDYDHQKWLGHSLSEIAREKAGIIKPRTPVVSALQAEAAAQIIRTRAAECAAPLEFVREPFTRFPVGLTGSHQKENAALAVAALRASPLPLDEAAIEQGLATVQWPARFQRWNARTVIDGAHNPAGARSLARVWQETFGAERATVILASLNDKDVAGFCDALAPIVGRVLLPRIRSERALAPSDLRLTIAQQLPAVPVTIFASFPEAWSAAQEGTGLVLLTGSLHFAGEALAYLGGEAAAFEECLQ